MAAPEKATTSTNSTKDGKDDSGESLPKCVKCNKRYGRRTCSQLACFKCCTDINCAGHKDHRRLAKMNDSILDGTNWINRAASQKRALAVLPGTFCEPAFHYLGDTLKIWSLREFFENPKWRDDALRKTKRRGERLNMLSGHSGGGGGGEEHGNKHSKKRGLDDDTEDDGILLKQRPRGSRRKRFRRIMNELYRKTLDETKQKKDESEIAASSTTPEQPLVHKSR